MSEKPVPGVEPGTGSFNPILKKPQPTFLPQCKQPRFTLIQKNRHNYCSTHVYIS